MQLFRFTAAISLIVAVSLLGIALEKQNLALKRAISLQQYRTDQLLERRAHLALEINGLTSPMRDSNRTAVDETDRPIHSLPKRHSSAPSGRVAQ